MESKKPDMLIVTDNTYVRGLHKGYYPEVQHELDRRGSELGISSVEYAEGTWGEDILTVRPHQDGAFYILNKYDGRYYPVDDANLTSTLAQQKAMVYKDALLMLGAKSIHIMRKTEEKEESNRSVNSSADGGFKGIDASVNASYARSKKAHEVVMMTLTAERPNNVAKPVEEVRAYLKRKGLSHDFYLTQLVERLERNDLVGCVETLTMTYLSELDKGHRITASLSAGFKLFKATLSTEWQESSHISYELSEQLEVTF